MRRFVPYETAEGERLMPEWYRRQPDEVRAAIRDVWIKLEQRKHWKRTPMFFDLKKAHAGLSEIRIWIHGKWKQRDRTFRLFGVRVVDRFVCFTGCEKFENGRTEPPRSDDVAFSLKGAYEANQGKECDDFIFD